MKNESSVPPPLRELARDLPVVEPDDAQREHVRTSLLAAAAATPQRAPAWRRAVPAVVVATAAAAAAVWALSVKPGSAEQPATPAVARTDGQPAAKDAAVPGSPAAPAEAGRSEPATVAGSREAEYARLPGTDDEIVRLRRGRLDVRTGTRPVRVVTGDAQVDASATAFSIEVEGDELLALDVFEGTATVRIRKHQVVILSAGERWRRETQVEIAGVIDAPVDDVTVVETEMQTQRAPEPGQQRRRVFDRPEPTRLAPPARTAPAIDPVTPRTRRAPKPRAPDALGTPASRATASRATEPRVPGERLGQAPTPGAATSPVARAPASDSAAGTPSAAATVTATATDERPVAKTPTGPTPAELAFSGAWKTLRAGNYGIAADAFARCVELAPNGALAMDARYWRAIALARAGRDPEARRAMQRFVDRHPASSRAAELAAMLGWLLLDAGEPERAGGLFERALKSSAPDVRASARKGLDALEAAR